MKKKKQNNQTLSQLIKIWDEKLKQSGFKDIEDRKTGGIKLWSGSVTLKDTNSEPYSTKNYGYTSLVWKESQAEYYRVAGQCLHEAEFKSLQHKLMWQLHAEGLSVSEISKELSISYKKVRYAIEQMQKEFGLKFCHK